MMIAMFVTFFFENAEGRKLQLLLLPLLTEYDVHIFWRCFPSCSSLHSNCSIFGTNHWMCDDFWFVARVFSLSANKHDYMPCSHTYAAPRRFYHSFCLTHKFERSLVTQMYIVECAMCVDLSDNFIKHKQTNITYPCVCSS